MDIPARPGQARPLARIPKDEREWYRIVDHTDAPAEVWIYDEIGYWGTPASDFCKALAELDAEEITVRINSPGGEVWDGLAILNALRDHPATITCKVDGIAASAASFIAQAGDRIVMGRQSQMMIHDASGLCLGDAADMQAMAVTLDSLSDVIASVYNDRAGGGVKVWRKAMQAETWYSADEAVAAGLADEVAKLPAKEEAAAARAVAQWDLSVFRHAGRENAPAPTVLQPAQPSTPVSVSPPAEPQVPAEPGEPEPVTPLVPLDMAALRAAIRDGMDVAARDAPAPEPAPVAAAAAPLPDPEPAASPVTVADTAMTAAEWRQRMTAAATDLPAPARAFPATVAEPDVPAEPEPEPAHHPVSFAEFLRAAVDSATNSLSAPPQAAPAAEPEPAQEPTIDPAAFRAALKGATR